MTARITSRSWVGPEGFGSSRGAAGVWSVNPNRAWHDFEWREISAAENARFRRHDLLSRVALAAVELLDADLARRLGDRKERTAVLLSTAGGCIGIDAEFWMRRMAEGTASPAAFVYTLPSTALGVIAIHYGLRGPSSCMILEAGDSGTLIREAKRLIEVDQADACLCVHAEASEPAEGMGGLIEPLGAGETRACAVLIERHAGDEEAAGGMADEESAADLFELCGRRPDEPQAGARG